MSLAHPRTHPGPSLIPLPPSPPSRRYFGPAITNPLQCLKSFQMSLKSPRQSSLARRALCWGDRRPLPAGSRRSEPGAPVGRAATPGPRRQPGPPRPSLPPSSRDGACPSQPGSAARPWRSAPRSPTLEPGTEQTAGAGAGGRRQQSGGTGTATRHCPGEARARPRC